MKALLTAKVGMFLVISSVLAVWTLLAAQPVVAHTTTLPTPGCSGLPDDAFFTPDVTAAITAATSTPALVTKQGTATRQTLRYAKITISALAAGELRVFDTSAGTGTPVIYLPSDAVLCRGTSQRATSRTSYTAHSSAERARAAANTAAGTTGITEVAAKRALTAAANALTAAANALSGSAATAATTAATAATTAATTAADSSASDEVTALGAAVTALQAAHDAFHTRFQIRATVEPGDESYVLVVALADPNTVPTLAVQFHGAIESTSPLQGLQGTLDAGDVDTRNIHITAPGLLTLETTGSTDTTGTFAMNPEVESGGSGGNFKIVLPVEADDTPAAAQALKVEGQTSTETGSYTLDMDFKVAMTTTATAVDMATAPTWTNTAIPGDDTTLQIDGSVDEDYFLFKPTANGFLTVEATDVAGRDANTRGTLYGPAGQIATDSNSAGDHFRFRVPVDNMPYLVKVTGTTGGYGLRFTFATAHTQGTSASEGPAASPACPAGTAAAYQICPSTGGAQERDRYLLTIMASGTLYVHTTGPTDTRGVIYGPNGAWLGEDDNSGQGTNFRIAVVVNPGLHILEVRGQNRETQGAYGLVTNFVAGGGVGTPGDRVAELEAEVARLERDLAQCRQPAATDARGVLENPSGGGPRSGIGLISGWVCAASDVEVRIFSAQGVLRATLNAAQGTSRPDTVGQCQHRSPNTGFGMTYNFNHLPEGDYTIRAYADDDEQIGREQTFEVVHLTTFSANDNDRFLRNLPAAECRVDDFPEAGVDTFLKWEQSIQNFVIEDAG